MAALDLSRDIDRLTSEIDDLRKHMSRLSRSAKNSGMEAGHEALARAEVLAQRARKQLARAEKQVTSRIEDRPFVSLAIAVGIGFLLAKMLEVGRYVRR